MDESKSNPSTNDPTTDKPSVRIKIGSQRESDSTLDVQPATTADTRPSSSESTPPVNLSTDSAVPEPSPESTETQPAEPTPIDPTPVPSELEGSSPAAPKSFPPPRLNRMSKDLQDEIDAALGDFSIDDLMSDSSAVGPSAADQVELDARRFATVMKVDKESVFFNLGGPHEGIAAKKQFDEVPEVGQQLDVVPVRFLTEEGLYEVVIPGASVEVADWSDLAEGVTVEAKITGHNKGGLECEVNHIRGFIPASQVSLYRIDDFEQYVNEKLVCVVTEANPDRRNLVLSHRAIMEREKQEAKEKMMAELEVGQIREGTVRSLRDFGAFVDIGGLDGLIHISQLSWERIKHPSEVLEEGQGVKVRIEKIDPETGKIGLSYRDLLVSPWDGVDVKYPIGGVVAGTVSKIMEFGAFVKLEPGVEGLVHISELAHHRVQRVSNVVKEGQVVEVKVLTVDKENQKLSLSIKAAQATQAAANAEEEEAAEPEEVEVRAPVVPEHRGPLKGGLEGPRGGEKFGLNW
ncbi:MAG: S1 RNA-binding domain-containing protein [Planctomycetales bacterium]|nr:S1 RNA-binding domain-containing protein [Planctomycetales bacterium]